MPWVSTYGNDAEAWGNETVAWASTDFSTWLGAVPGQLVRDEFTFLGPTGTANATVHIHDLASPLHNDTVFIIKGGPAGNQWICKHACTVPDTGFTVSVDPLDVPPNVWIGGNSVFPIPNSPAIVGSINVTFSL